MDNTEYEHYYDLIIKDPGKTVNGRWLFGIYYQTTTARIDGIKVVHTSASSGGVVKKWIDVYNGGSSVVSKAGMKKLGILYRNSTTAFREREDRSVYHVKSMKISDYTSFDPLDYGEPT